MTSTRVPRGAGNAGQAQSSASKRLVIEDNTREFDALVYGNLEKGEYEIIWGESGTHQYY